METVIFRLALAVVLSGLIGKERENKNRPAGLRTHILVCMSATIVMLSSEFLLNKYGSVANIDPARLGAQVISGIGFLGAGTIIREGGSVKGLTTAASLWSVACIGLAIGMGFYEGAIFGTILLYVTLFLLGKLEKVVKIKTYYLEIIVDMDDTPGRIGEIGTYLGEHNVNISNMRFQHNDCLDENGVSLFLSLKLPKGITYDKIAKDIMLIKGVHSVNKN
jgi:putative Mg2+ transporter-C (MgtC) family protein